jgi:hypothetical protein
MLAIANAAERGLTAPLISLESDHLSEVMRAQRRGDPLPKLPRISNRPGRRGHPDAFYQRPFPFGFLHADVRGRDSLALDLLEPIRPKIEQLALSLVGKRVFRKADFIELADGNCRILAPLTHDLATTMPRWAQEAAPWAERVAHVLADASGRPIPRPTRLTSAARRAGQRTSQAAQRRTAAERSAAARIARRVLPASTRNRPETSLPVAHRCEGCGIELKHHQRRWCIKCWPSQRQAAGRTGSAQAKAAIADPAVRERKGTAIAAGKASATAARLHALGYQAEDWARIHRQLTGLPLKAIQAATGLSYPSASAIRAGARIPHPRHWAPLDNLSTT